MAFDFPEFDGGNFNFPAFGGRQRAPMLMDQNEQQTFWDTLAGAGSGLLSGLGTIGYGLENLTGARAIKGLLRGKPREALSILNPFSDTFGWTDPNQRTSGAEAIGLSKDTPLFSMGGAAGLAADIALDPATYLSLGAGALTKLGKVAQKAGVTARTGAARAAGLAAGSDELTKLAQYLSSTPAKATGLPGHFGRPVADIASDLAGKSLGGNIGFGIPFTGEQATEVIPWDTIGKGLTKIPVVGPKLGKVGEGLSYAGRLGKAAFQKKYLERTTEAGQEIARLVSEGIPEARAAGMAKFHEVTGTEAGKYLDEASSESLRRMVELVDPMSADPLGDISRRTKTANEQLLLARKGVRNVTELGDPALGYFHRSASPEYTGGSNFRQLDISSKLDKARESSFKLGIPTVGARSINEFLSTPIGTRNTQDLMNDLINNYVHPSAATKLGPDEFAKRVEGFAKFKEYVGDFKTKFFGNHAFIDMSDGFVSGFESVAKDSKLIKGLVDLGEGSLIPGRAGAAAGPDTMSVLKAMQDSELGVMGTGRNLRPLDKTIEVVSKKLGHPATDAEVLTYLDSIHIPKSDYADIVGMGNLVTKPAWLKKTLEVIDSATEMFKTGVTVLWPGYLTRNMGSGIAHNVMFDAFDPAITNPAMRYIQPLLDASNLRAGGVIKGLDNIPNLPGVTDADKTRALQELVIQWGIAGKKTFEHHAQLPVLEQLADIVPGIGKPTLGQPGGIRALGRHFKGKGFKEWIDPRGIKGVAGRVEDVQPLAAAGRDISSQSDEVNRVAMFIAKLKQGFAPEAAREAVMKAHFDFSNLSKFEAGTMRRMAPFYSFFRQALPGLTKEMFERPGGAMAQVFRAAAKARGPKEGYLPEFLGDRIALPIGQEKEGQQRYLSQLGLPFEDLGQLAAAPGQYLLGQLSPYVKAPLELMTNRQFYSGRELSDLRSRTGAPVGLENLVMNSPFARVASVFGPSQGLFRDPRKSTLDKAINFLTGARLTDVDMETARRQAGRRFLQQQLRQMPNVREMPTFFIPKDLQGQASEEELALTQLLNSLRTQQRR